MRRDSARILSDAITDASCRRHKTLVHHKVTLNWHLANKSCFYPLNTERLARKQPIPFLRLWYGATGDRIHDLPTTRRLNAFTSRPPRGVNLGIAKEFDGHVRAHTHTSTCTWTRCWLFYYCQIHVYILENTAERTEMMNDIYNLQLLL